MKNLDTLNEVPWKKEEEAFNAIAEIANYAAMTEEEQNRYDDALREFQDTYATYKHAENTGRKKGKEEGKAEDLVNLMKNFKMSIEDALKGLSIPESEWDDYRKMIKSVETQPVQ